jgi:hypothetical protein
MRNKRKASSKGMLQKYKAAQTNGNITNTGMKSLVDLILGAALGAGIGAGSGKAALPVGLLLIAGSHYFDEETGLLRVAGSATIAYGIGKAIQNKNAIEVQDIQGVSLGEVGKAKERLISFKDEILAAFYLDKVLNKEEKTADAGEIGAIDLSALEVFDQNNKNEAVRHELESNDIPDLEDDFASDSDDFSFAMIEENPDLSSI